MIKGINEVTELINYSNVYCLSVYRMVKVY